MFGATAGAGRLLGLDRHALQRAFGIAASQAGGLRLNFGTMTKPFHAGLSCRTGVEAALLARSGFTATEVAIEGRFGWHEVICRGEGELDLVLADPPPPYAVEEGLRYKPYPCCGANHHAIDAVIGLMKEHGLVGDDVAEVEVGIESRTLRDVLVYAWPATGLEGKFSLAYNVAAAMVDGEVTVGTFADDHLATLEAARPRVHVLGRDDMPTRGADVTIRTVDGRTFHREQLVLRGDIEDPFTWEDLARKFRANTSELVKADDVEGVIDAIRHLDEAPSLQAITEPLLGAPQSR
jgi:2-methylcitrate dehydratase PrpD